eukprot:3984358-Amphidinium_carterae.1
MQGVLGVVAIHRMPISFDFGLYIGRANAANGAKKGHTRLVVPTINLDAYGIPTPSPPCHLSFGAANCDVTCTTNGLRLMCICLRFGWRRSSTASRT